MSKINHFWPTKFDEAGQVISDQLWTKWEVKGGALSFRKSKHDTICLIQYKLYLAKEHFVGSSSDINMAQQVLPKLSEPVSLQNQQKLSPASDLVLQAFVTVVVLSHHAYIGYHLLFIVTVTSCSY